MSSGRRAWGALVHNFIFFFVHFLVQNPISLLLAALLSQATCVAATSFDDLLSAHDAVIRHRRLYLAVDSQSDLGHQ